MGPRSIRAAQLHPRLAYQPDHALESLTRERSVVLERLCRPQRILEAGAATGYFSQVLTKVGHEVTAIEGDVRAVEAAQAQGINVRQGNIEDPSLWDALPERFDTVLFMHVLEHLVDPWTVLRLARKRLAEGGRVLSLLPNVAAWRIRKNLFLHGTFEYEETGIMDRTHLRFFTVESAIELHRAAGFGAIRCEPTDVCVPLERRLRVQLRQKRLAEIWSKAMSGRFLNLCSEIVLIEASIGSQ